MAVQLNQGVDAIANQWVNVALNASQTGNASNSFFRVNYNQVLDNSDGAFDAVTNFRFQPKLSGIYLITASVQVESSGNDILDAAIGLFKNGSSLLQGQQFVANANGAAISDYVTNISCLTKMNGSTNYLELAAYCLNAAAPTFTIIGNPLNTWAQFLYVGTFRRT